jgi:hypothetical protein
MDQKTMVILTIVAAVILIAAVIIIYRKSRSHRLKERFGTEYVRAVLQEGNSSKAEAELLNREKRVHSFSIHALTPAARERFVEEWSAIQRRFVDDPALAVAEADSLVNGVMAARGYPMADFDQRVADVSVAYPAVVQNYRSARSIVLRHNRGDAGTEDLRQAMVYFRSLFDELLELPKSAESERILHERAS